MADVKWFRTALHDLESLWLEADDRDGLNAAVDRAEDSIRRDPLHVGESREGDERILIEHPVVLSFLAEPDGRTAIIFAIWTAPPARARGPGGN